jgi:integron integrase
MKDFAEYLTRRRLVPAHQVKFYVLWVTKLHDSVGKRPGEDLRVEEIEWFMTQMATSHQDWQVRQAREAINTFEYFKSQACNKKQANSGSDEEWRLHFDTLKRSLRVKGRAYRTEQTYLTWVRQFCGFVKGVSDRELTGRHVIDFLSFLAVERKVAKATQDQALNALVFFYRHVLGKDIGTLRGAVRAPRRRRLPVVLTEQEVRRLFEQMHGTWLLMAKLTYGSGLRLRECLSLRIKDVDLDRGCVTIRAGKGDKDRETVFPESLKADFRRHVDSVRVQYESDRAGQMAGVYLPNALERKYPGASKEWIWYWVFPSRTLSIDPRSNIVRRHHVHENNLQRAIKLAAGKAGLVKRVTVHTLRHRFATHLLEKGYDIRTIQELLGHASVQTTMIYTHVAAKNKAGVRSPLDP